MALMQRRARPKFAGETSRDMEDTKKSTGFRNGKAVGTFVVLLVLAAISALGQAKDKATVGLPSSTALRISGSVFEIDTGVRVIVDFDAIEAESTTVTLGPHKATLLLPRPCANPGMWLRLEGDALVAVVLTEGATSWEGSFTLPISGSYSLTAYWYGCDRQTALQKKVLTTVVAKNVATVDVRKDTSLFPLSAWISSKKFTQESDVGQPYIWHNLEISTAEADLMKTSGSIVAKDSATFPETKFYKFGELSNYELVCWVGGDSADKLRASFRLLRPLVSAHQRPFKFHLYNSSSFTSPDASWTEENKKTFRKCKHILISMDPVKTPSTQTAYIQQVKNFIGHLLKAFPDETFPIWMFTVLESPVTPTNCHQPSLPRTSDHPCNDALKDLFRNSPFPERVRFLDNTDVTLPHLGENSEDVTTAIALRIFVFVGKQVETWRAKGQVGGIKGLRRGDILEPNFELVPYLDWGK